MAQEPPFDIGSGDTFQTAMLSPCVGGLIRTWTDTGSRLWGVADPASLSSVMGQGVLARTLREDRRFREVALLHEASGTLLLQPRFPTEAADGSVEFEGRHVRLIEPGLPTGDPVSDLKDLIGRAVRSTVVVDGFLLLERGGWDAPPEPYALFIVDHDGGELSTVETAPAPNGAGLWQDHIRPGAAGATMSAPATDETLGVVPALIIDACATWGLAPWDLALTYGSRT